MPTLRVLKEEHLSSCHSYFPYISEVRSFELSHFLLSQKSFGLRLDLKNLVKRKKFRKVTFFLVFGLKKITKKKYIQES